MITVETFEKAFNPVEFNENQVKAYSTTNLFSFGFINPKGSTFTVRMWIRTLIMCGIATFLLFFRCPDTKTLGWKFCFPILASGDGLIFASLVSFLLGLFQSTTFSRWWSTREKLGAVMNNISYITIVTQACVTSNDANIISLKARVLRWLNLTHALIYKQANRDLDFSDLGELVTKEEVDALYACPNMPATTMSWVIHGWKELAVKNAINPAAVVAHAMSYMATIFVAAQDVFTFLETQMPYSYLHLLTLITKIHLAFVVFYGGGIIGAGVAAEAWGKIIFGYAIIITNNVIYEGLLSIHDMLVNPLGKDIGDFPTKLYTHNTESFSKYVQGGPTIEIVSEKI